MKKFYVFLLSLVTLLVGCASVPASKVSYDVNVEYDSENPAVTLVVAPSWSSNIINGSGFGGFFCTFVNKTDKAAKVVWDESSINYAGNSYVPFLEGQKYIQAQTPMSPAVIAKGGSLSKQVHSSSQPHYNSGQYGGWVMLPIKSNTVQLLFCIKTEEKEQYITATIKANIAE